MSFKEGVVKKFRLGIQSLFKMNNVEVMEGVASFSGTNSLKIDEGNEIGFKKCIIAAGSAPRELPTIPFDGSVVISSDEALTIKKVPKSLVVIGAGVIGLEMGSIYQRLGTKVTFIEMQKTILAEFDSEISGAFHKLLKKEGKATIKLGAVVEKVELVESGAKLTYKDEEGSHQIDTELVLVAIGRVAKTKELNLQAASVTESRGFIEVDRSFITANPNIIAIGDLVKMKDLQLSMLAHRAYMDAHQVIEMLYGEKNTFYNTCIIPSVVYTQPEIATVGLLEDQIKEQKIEYKKYQGSFMYNGRYVAMGHGKGTNNLVKVLIDKATRKILGASLIGPNAGELIMEITLAMQNGLTFDAILSTIHPHPTLSEIYLELN